MSEVLQRFIERAVLLDEHREELKTKRGFPDDVINEFLLRSACAANKVIIEDLVKDFGEKKVAEVGLLHNDKGAYIPSIKYLTPNILIPYREDGKIVAVRPHKDFQKGQKLRVFYANEKYDKDREVVVGEGEFKAIAAKVYGEQAISIPGISSFVGDKEAGRKFDEFYEELALLGVHKLVFLFDNEDKGTPGLPKYKEEAKDRYDTQYYSYLMASKINKEEGDLEAKVGWIPDKYRNKNGKADIDGMLADKISAEAFAAIIDEAEEPEDFFASLPQEAVDVMHAKLAKRAERISFRIKAGCYYYITESTAKDGKIVEKEKLASNFVMRYSSTIVTKEGALHNEFLLKNNENEEKLIIFTGKQLTSVKDFKSHIADYGKFSWVGGAEALDALFLEVIPVARKIITPRRTVGWDENLKHIFFDNCVIDENGLASNYDKDGLVKIGDGYYELEPSESRPKVNFSVDTPIAHEDLVKEIGNKLVENYNNPRVLDAYAWFIAAVYKPWIFPLDNLFPILCVVGKKASGKTKMMQWLLRMFYDKAEPSAFSSTKAGVRNKMSELSYLPIWIDEFRNDKDSTENLDLLRLAYDHGSIVLSEGRDYRAKVFKIVSSVAISGEEVPDDNTGAAQSRMVIVDLHDRPAGTQYDWFQENCMHFSGVFQYLIKNKKTILPAIISRYDSYLKTYTKMESGLDKRRAFNFAIIHAIEEVVLGVKQGLETLDMTKVIEDIKQDEKDFDIAQALLLRCMSEYNNRLYEPKIKESICVREHIKNKKLCIVFNPNTCTDIYNESAGRAKKNPLLASQVRRALKNCPWIENSHNKYRIGNGQARCYEAYIEKAPQDIVSAAYGIAGDYKNRFEDVVGEHNSSQNDDTMETWNG